MDAKENRALFLEALESGKYAKVRFSMRAQHDLEFLDDNYGYCFWGLGCEIYRQKNPETSRWSGICFAIQTETCPEAQEGGEFHGLPITDSTELFFAERPPSAVVEFFGIPVDKIDFFMKMNDDKNDSFEYMAAWVKWFCNEGKFPLKSEVK